MRFYLTVALVVILMSGCARTSSLAPRPASGKCSGLAAGDAMGQGFAAQSDVLAETDMGEQIESDVVYY